MSTGEERTGEELYGIIVAANVELQNVLALLLTIYADVNALTNPTIPGKNALYTLLKSNFNYLKNDVVKSYVAKKLYTSQDRIDILPDVDAKKLDSNLLLDILIKYLLASYKEGICNNCDGQCCPNHSHSMKDCNKCRANGNTPTNKCWHKCKSCKKTAKECQKTICCTSCNTCIPCNKIKFSDDVNVVLCNFEHLSSTCPWYVIITTLEIAKYFRNLFGHITIEECKEFIEDGKMLSEQFKECKELDHLERYVTFLFGNIVRHVKAKLSELPCSSAQIKDRVDQTMENLKRIFECDKVFTGRLKAVESLISGGEKNIIKSNNDIMKTNIVTLKKMEKVETKDSITRFHDSKTQYYGDCERFKKEYKENPEKFRKIGEKGYIYKKNLVIATGNKCRLFLGHSNLDWVAIKRCEKNIEIESRDELKEKIEEIRILESINASVEKKDDINIIDLLDWTYDEDFYYIITPLYDFTLGNFLKTKRNFETRVEMLKQLLKVINRLHSIQDRKLLHKDLKPNNIMIQKNNHSYNVKLIDFGESRHYVPGQTITQENCGDLRWLPPGISIAVKSRFTSIHESFVVCMLAVYILSNGKHPFITPNDVIELKNIYDKVIGRKEEKISIRNIIDLTVDYDLVDFFNEKFNEFFPYFRGIRGHTKDEKEDFNKTLCVSKIKEELKDVHSYRSPNHTRAHRLLAMLPLNEEGNTIISTSIPNCSTLWKYLSSYRFTSVKTKSDMTLNDFQKQLTEELNEYEDSQQIYLFLYIVTHSTHDVKAKDVFFRMKVCEKDEMGNVIKEEKDKPKCSIEPIYIGVLLNEINDSFERKDLLTIVLLFEGCRTKKDLQMHGTSKPFPENVVVFYSAKLGKTSTSASKYFATASRFCDKLIDNIKPGKSLKDVFDNTTKALNKVYAIKDEKGKYDIYEENEPVEDGKEPLYLFKPELFINCNECKKTAKLKCEECKSKLIKDEEGKYDICDENEPVEDDKEPKPELSINCNECKKKLKFNCEECEKKLSFIF